MAGGMKRLAKETAVYGLSSIIGRFLNWMLVPMYTRVFTDTGDFGIVTNLYGWVALLLVLLTFGMETGFFRFINKKEETEPMRVYATTMAWVGGLSGAFLILVLLFLHPIAHALSYTAPLEYLGMMLGITAVDAFCCIPFAYLRYAGQAYRFAGIKLLSIFLNIFLNIFFLVICPYARNNRLVLSPRLRSRICIRSQRDYHRYYIPLPLAEYDARLQGTSGRNPAERDAALFISHPDFGYCRYLQSDSRQDSLPALV